MQTIMQYNAAIYVRLSKEDLVAGTGTKTEGNGLSNEGLVFGAGTKADPGALPRENTTTVAGAKTESTSILNQKQLILDFVKDKPDINIVSIRVDDGYTGTNYDRPAFQLMLDDIKAGKVNCVIVKDLSRFGREYINAGKYIDRLFPYYGVRLIAINDHIDTITKNSSDDFSITVKNLMNDNYCRDISIKIRSQLQVKRKNGEFIGAFAPYGYKKLDNKCKSLEIDEYPAGIVQDIFRWKLDGMSQDAIARKLTEQGVLSPLEYKRSQGMRYKTGFKKNKHAKWTAVAVKRILINPVYVGTLIQGVRTRPNYKIKEVVVNKEEDWVIIENAHEAIISCKTYLLVQRLLELDTRTSPYEETVFPLAGLLVCGDCHSAMVRKTSSSGGKTYAYYVCSANKNDGVCSGHRISEEQLMRAVLVLLQEHIRLIVELDGCLQVIKEAPLRKINMKKAEDRLLKMDDEIERYRRLKISVYEDMKDGIISKTDFFDIRGQYDERIADALLAKEQLRREMDLYMNDASEPQKWMQEFLEYRNIQTLTRSVAVECIEEIAIFEDKKMEVVFTHAQNYTVILTQVTEYYQQQNAKREVV
jgi:DNA invertase Pin-like site-specific DNA recombinase